MPISMETYQRVTLEDPEGKWELVCGRLREKPPMTTEHEDVARNLVWELSIRLSRREFSVGQDSPKLGVPGGNYRIPDVCVIPREAVRRRRREHPAALEVYDESMLLVVEVWSPSTGESDIDDKLKEYQRRGGLEIWLIHPYERTLTAWCRRPDGSYVEQLRRGGTVQPAHLPDVTIDLDTLFE
jgi:Uma2 family endonuclease